jgi:hypothetical protein
VPDAVPAKAIPPASSAASALGTARPTSGRTSQAGSADVGEGRDDEQAHRTAEARAERTRMCRSLPDAKPVRTFPAG